MASAPSSYALENFCDCPNDGWQNEPPYVPPTTSTGTTTTTTPGPCHGQCKWSYDSTLVVWNLVSNSCRKGCNCLTPCSCPTTIAPGGSPSTGGPTTTSAPIYTYTSCVDGTNGTGTVFQCSTTTTTTTTTTTGTGTTTTTTTGTTTTTAAPCTTSTCLWFNDPILHLTLLQSCPFPCGCSSPGDIPVCSSATTACTYSPPPPCTPQCAGACKFLCAGPPGKTLWFHVGGGCNGDVMGHAMTCTCDPRTYGSCACAQPSPDCNCGDTTVTPCQSVCPTTTTGTGTTTTGTTTTTTTTTLCPGCCTGTCTYLSDGTQWNFQGTTCTSCACYAPGWIGPAGLQVCNACQTPTSTSSTTTTTSTTKPPCYGGCTYQCVQTTCSGSTGWVVISNTCTNGTATGCDCNPTLSIGSGTGGQTTVAPCVTSSTTTTTTTTKSPCSQNNCSFIVGADCSVSVGNNCAVNCTCPSAPPCTGSTYEYIAPCVPSTTATSTSSTTSTTTPAPCTGTCTFGYQTQVDPHGIGSCWLVLNSSNCQPVRSCGCGGDSQVHSGPCTSTELSSTVSQACSKTVTTTASTTSGTTGTTTPGPTYDCTSNGCMSNPNGTGQFSDLTSCTSTCGTGPGYYCVYDSVHNSYSCMYLTSSIGYTTAGGPWSLATCQSTAPCNSSGTSSSLTTAM